MLMQNAQMHQIIMHNMMLKALPVMAPPSPTHTAYLGQVHTFSSTQIKHKVIASCFKKVHVYFQDSYQAKPSFVRSDFQPSGSAVHHHHYSPTAAAPQLPPITYHTWLPRDSPTSAGQAGEQLSPLHHVTAAPTRLPPLNV